MFSAIVSVNNPRVKNAVQLKESRTRRREGLFLVDGIREIERAMTSGFEVVELFWNAGADVYADEKVDLDKVLHKQYGNSDRRNILHKLLSKTDSLGIPTIPVSATVFAKIVFGERNEGVVGVVRSKTTTLTQLEEIFEKKDSKLEAPLIGVIEGVEKPGNVGAILRSADGAGIHALMIAAESYDVFNPNAIRGSLGAIFNIPIVVAPAKSLLAWLRTHKIQRATALCDESIPYSSLDYTRPTAIVLGSEAEGLTKDWAVESQEDRENTLLQKIRLPMLGIADSLNVSNAAAILFYEARRVRSY